jgi:hypothetical protein
MLIGCTTTPSAHHPQWGRRIGGCSVSPQRHADGEWWLDLDRHRPSNIDGYASGKFWADARVFVSGEIEGQGELVEITFAPDVDTMKITSKFRIAGAAKSACDSYELLAANSDNHPVRLPPNSATSVL